MHYGTRQLEKWSCCVFRSFPLQAVDWKQTICSPYILANSLPVASVTSSIQCYSEFRADAMAHSLSPLTQHRRVSIHARTSRTEATRAQRSEATSISQNSMWRLRIAAWHSYSNKWQGRHPNRIRHVAVLKTPILFLNLREILFFFSCIIAVYLRDYAIFRRVHEIRKKDYLLRCVCPSVRPSIWNNSIPTGRILIKSDT